MIHILITFLGTVNPNCVTTQNGSIVDFISSSPLFTNKSVIYQVSNYTWGFNLTWTANTNQSGKYIELTKILVTFLSIIGLQPFCVAAVDNHGQASDQYCVMILVDSTGANPGFYAPTFIQGTASPVGTVMSTQTRFSIQGKNFFTMSFTGSVKFYSKFTIEENDA